MAKDIRVALTLDNKQFNSALQKSEKEVNSFAGGSKTQLKALGAAFAALITTDVISGIIKTGSAFQDLQNSLNVVFGSVQRGADEFARIKVFAAETQFSVQQLTQAFVQLKGAGVEPTDALLKTFADTASVVTDQMGAFQAMIDLVTRSTAGGLGLEDLNRLADRGIPVFAILEEKLGLARLEISKFGKTAEGANKIIGALTEGLDKRFGGALENSSQNISRLTNNMGDAFEGLQSALFNLFSDELAASITKITTAIESVTNAVEGLEGSGETLKKWAKILGTILLFLINPLAGLTRGLGVLSTRVLATGGFFKGLAESGRQLIKNFGVVSTVIKSKARAMFGLGESAVAGSKALQGASKAASFLFKSVTRVGSAIAGAIGLNYVFSESLEEVKEKTKDLSDAFVGPPIPPEILEQQQADAKALIKRINELASAARGFSLNDYRTELEQLTQAQEDAQTAINDLNFAFSLSNGTLAEYEELLAAANAELAKSTKDLKEFNEQLAEDNLPEYEKYIVDLTQSMIDYTKEQNHADSALTFFNQLFDDGRLSVEAYRFILEQLGESIIDVAERLEGATDSVNKFEDAIAESTNDLQQVLDQLDMNAFEKSQDDIRRNLEELRDETLRDLKDELEGLDVVIDADSIEKIEQKMKDVTAATQVAILNQQELGKEGYDASRLFSQGWKDALDEFVDATTDKAAKAKEVLTTFTKGVEDAFVNFAKTGKLSFKDLLDSMVEMLIRSQVQKLMATLLSSASGSGIGDFFSKIFGKAQGGPVAGGTPYVVGEKGPELFVPNSSGQIVPNNKMGGGGTVNNTYITNAISAVDAKSVAQLFAENRKTLLGTVQMAQKEMPYG